MMDFTNDSQGLGGEAEGMEQELPECAWSDDCGQFRNVIALAVEKSLGVKARYIPPSRPEANGLVEVMNRIINIAHGGERSRLAAAVLAHNNKPDKVHNVSPETMWRTLRTAASRWRNAGVKEAIPGPKEELTEAEWLKYLDDSEKAFSNVSPKELADEFHSKVEPVTPGRGPYARNELT